jgi:hypothetical protein
MLTIYGGYRDEARVEELAEEPKGLEADPRLGGDCHDAAGGLVEHPGGDLKGEGIFAVQPAVEDRLSIPQALIENIDLPAEPGMERIPDGTDIDQSGLVLRSSTTRNGRTKRWTTRRLGRSTVADWCGRTEARACGLGYRRGRDAGAFLEA